MKGEGRQLERIKRLGAIVPHNLSPRWKILHRITKRVKLHRTIVVRGELANGNKILNKIWRNKNIIKMKIIKMKLR